MSHLRVLIIHTRYTQPGGEDTVVANEAALLRERGVPVKVLEFDNRALDGMSPPRQLATALWNQRAADLVSQTIREFRANVVHVHNTFAAASPAVIRAAKAAGTAVVMTLHNPRLLCPAATFWYDGHVCTRCLGRTLPWPGIVRRCYRKSLMHTLGVSSVVAIHRMLKTWTNCVDRFVVSTDFYRKIFIQGGIPSKAVVVKPHFVFDPKSTRSEGEEAASSLKAQKPYAVFIARLEPEKGVCTLLEAWRILKQRGYKLELKVRGDGTLSPWFWEVVERENLDIIYVPRLSRQELMELIRQSQFLVWPSEGWYETFGLVAIEAFACGVPVLASNTGVATAIVRHGITGFHFQAGDPRDLAMKAMLLSSDRQWLASAGQAARGEYESKYAPDKNFKALISIYQDAISGREEKVLRV